MTLVRTHMTHWLDGAAHVYWALNWKDASPESLHQLPKWRADCMPCKMSVCVSVYVDVWERMQER